MSSEHEINEKTGLALSGYGEERLRSAIGAALDQFVESTKDLNSLNQSETVPYMVEHCLKPLLLTDPANAGKSFEAPQENEFGKSEHHLKFCCPGANFCIVKGLESLRFSGLEDKQYFLQGNSKADYDHNTEYRKDLLQLPRPSAENGYEMPIKMGDKGFGSGGGHTFMIRDAVYITEDTPDEVKQAIADQIWDKDFEDIEPGMVYVRRMDSTNTPAYTDRLYEDYDEFVDKYTDPEWGNDTFVNMAEIAANEMPSLLRGFQLEAKLDKIEPKGLSDYFNGKSNDLSLEVQARQLSEQLNLQSSLSNNGASQQFNVAPN